MHAHDAPISTSLPRPRARRRGYALLLALALVMLASVVMVSVSRAAMLRLVASRNVQDELQIRWGAASCRKALLPRAEQIITTEERRQRQPLISVRTRLLLGSQPFDVIVGDEQAKLNVNQLLRRNNISGAEAGLRHILTGTGLANRVNLRAGRDKDAWPIGSFGQIFSDIDLARLPEERFAAEAPLDRLTCWGDGKINAARAAEICMAVLTAPDLTSAQVASLVTLRKESPELISEAIPLLQSGSDAEGAAQPIGMLLDRRSRCHSVWITIEGSRGKTHSFAVLDRTDTKRPREHDFAW